MDDLDTPRLVLHAVDVAEAERIREQLPGPEDRWVEGYPFDGDIRAVTMLLRATEAYGEQQPFGYYRITRRSDGLAIGGIGFHGPPSDSGAEIGYGLAGSARGQGYATEALRALTRWAGGYGLRKLIAETAADNLASQRTLENAGFHRIDGPERTGDGQPALHYAITLIPPG
jgi:RimJ/RimL family protein N-acetyltransferase